MDSGALEKELETIYSAYSTHLAKLWGKEKTFWKFDCRFLVCVTAANDRFAAAAHLRLNAANIKASFLLASMTECYISVMEQTFRMRVVLAC